MTIKRSLAAATFGATAALTAAFMPTANAEMKHEGVTVNILTRRDPSSPDGSSSGAKSSRR